MDGATPILKGKKYKDLITQSKKLVRYADTFTHITVPDELLIDQIKLREAINELKVLLNMPYEVKTTSGRVFTQLEIAYEEKDCYKEKDS